MDKRFYVVREAMFENVNKQSNAYFRALAYCKSRGIDEKEIIELHNDSEYAYYKRLVALYGAENVGTHSKFEVMKGFENAVGESIQPLRIDVPFIYYDDKGKLNYEYLVTNPSELNTKLIYSKILLDKFWLEYGGYLKIVYLNDKNEYVEWKIGDYKEITSSFKNAQHKKVLAEHRAIREQQRYDRLLKLRSEGRISQNQTLELYRLEEIYGKRQ